MAAAATIVGGRAGAPAPRRDAAALLADLGTLHRVSEAFEVSPDDAAGVAEAIRRAATGAVVHVVRDGQPLADIVPAAPWPMTRRRTRSPTRRAVPRAR